LITESLRHCSGIGPVRLSQLHDAGIRSWYDVIEHASKIPSGIRENLLSEVTRAQVALDQNDIGYFVGHFCPQDKWRILSEFLDQTSFFDIETSGLDIDASITVIVCWHRGRFHTFVEHENLDDFLDLLDDVKLLASFNGASFDVPRVLDAFHIPRLPCPHIDLRWSCYHAGLRGSLKSIERNLKIVRPPDIADTDGELAVQLWSDWLDREDAAARYQLICYCAADVLTLILLAQHLANIDRYDTAELWSHLPTADPVRTSQGTIEGDALVANLFGAASPSKLRTRRRVVG